MGDNVTNIEIPINEWVDLYTLSGITVGLPLMVENNGSPDVYLAVQAAQPPVDHDSYNVIQRGNGVRLQNAQGATGAWAFCNTFGGKVAVGVAGQDGFFTMGGGGGLALTDLGNSSEVNLAAGAEFIGSWADTNNFGIAYVSIYSDQDSATDGLIIEQSTTMDEAHFNDVFTISAMRGKNFSINPHARYLRVRYVNGSTDTTHFHLQTILKSNGLDSSHRIKDDITTDDDARLVKSVMMTKANDQNEYKNIEFNNPMPVNGGQLYPHDVNLEHSEMNTFSGTPIDLLDNRWSEITDTTSNNPKIMRIEFERPMQTTIIGLVSYTGTFSNTVIKFGISNSPAYTLLDESADPTLKQIVVATTAPITLNYLILEFHTVNTVTLSGMNMSKSDLVTAQIQGVNDFNQLVSVGATTGGNLRVSIQEYGDTPAIDAFDRLRVSDPFTIFDSKQIYDKQPLFYDESIGGSATSVHSTTHARTQMTVTASASDFVIRQTKQRFNYQPGKSELVFITFFAPQDAGCTKRIGLFDGTGTNYLTPNNGIFLEITENDVTINIAKAGTTTESISQANWNVDPLDGTGPSFITLDLDTAQIFVMDFEWLGVGRARCGIVYRGIAYYFHYFNHSNELMYSTVYMSTPNLPARYDIQSDGTGGGYLDHICCTVMSEGGIELTGVSRSIDTQNIHLDANAADTIYVLLALRLKSTHLDLTVLPETMSMISETNDDFRWSLLLNPTYAGTLTYTDITSSGCQRAAGTTTNTISAEGIKLASGYAKSAGSIESKIVNNLRIGSMIDGTRDELILAVTPLASNADFQGSLTFRELL